MSLVADTATLVHGYTMADIERYAGKSANQVGGGISGMRFDDKYEVSWSAIVEMLYERQTRPTWQELMDAGRYAVLGATAVEAREHGFDRMRGAGSLAPQFAKYWETGELSEGRGPATIRAKGGGHTDFTEHLVERMALPAALGALTGLQYEAVIALAVFGNQVDAARALGIGVEAFKKRIKLARSRFLEAWYAPETSPVVRNGRGDTCTFGHSRAEHSIVNSQGRRQCKICRRNAKRRAMARETPEQTATRKAAEAARRERKRAAETPEQRDARNAATRARRAGFRGETHVIE